MIWCALMQTKTNRHPPQSFGQILTLQEAADRLNLSIHTLRSWKAQRRIGYIQLGRAIRIPASEVERLLAENTIPPATSD